MKIHLGRTLLLMLAAVGVAAGLVASLSTALYTDTASVPGNTFTTGTVDITTSPTSALVTFTSPVMAPGDQVTAPITVSNVGTLDLRYAIKSTTTESVLAAVLDLTVKSGVSACTDAGFGLTGTVLYGPNDLGSTAGTNVVGNPATGAQAGDRALAASANEVLCFNVSLPLAATTGQGLTSTATFDFMSEQTKNN